MLKGGPKIVAYQDFAIRERRLIEGAWEKHRAVEVTFLEPATVMALREAVLKQPYQVVHFMGHGAFAGHHQEEGALLFEKSDGTAHAVSGFSLASVLGDVRSLRLIVLNACDTARVSNQQGHDPLTGVATALVARGLFAVVAMQFPISDQAAIAFTRSFYPRLAAGDPVDAAAAEGRLAIHTGNQDSLEWSTPVLFMRSPEGIPFEDLVPELVKAEPGVSPTGRDDLDTDLRADSKQSFLGLLPQLFQQRKTKPRRPRRPLKAFLCYASEDERAVRKLYGKLRKKNISVWLDREDLLPGQNWKFEINEALRTSDVVILCLSETSVTREGYIQKEIRNALDIAEEKPEGTIFIIPLRLEKCTIPRRLYRWQYVDLFQARGLARLMRALRSRAEELGLAIGSGAY
ncbi:MAG: CHAT domain-containing protein [bacterium]|nr:CHAT domain-containing protein [bacterium]